MDSLIYNRDHPVPLNFEDLNRIEEWTNYLANYLKALGYVIYVQTGIWEMKSIPWQSEIDRIRGNIVELYEAFHTLPDWREITYSNSLDFEQVNTMEWDLQMIYDWLSRMDAAFWYSCELYSGEV